MSENKNVTKSLDTGIDIINAGGFEKDQMQAVVAKDSDWLTEKLKDIQTDVDLFNIWVDEQTAKLATSGFSADDIINSRAVALTMLKLPCGSRQMPAANIEQKFLSIKHIPISPTDSNINGQEVQIDAFGNQAEFIQDGLSVIRPGEFYGNKGVYVQGLSDEDLPIDAAGNRADLVCPEGSILNRMTDVDFFKAWTTGVNHLEKSVFLSDSYSPGLSELDPNFDGDELERALCDLKHSKQFVPEIALSHLMKKHGWCRKTINGMIVQSPPIEHVVDKCSSAVLASKHGNNPAVAYSQNLYKSEYPFDTSVDVCFQKVPSNVEDAAIVNDIHIAAFDNRAEIMMTSDALRRRIPLQKAPKWFFHGGLRGWTALRIKGLLKRKCKKGARKHYSKK